MNQLTKQVYDYLEMVVKVAAPMAAKRAWPYGCIEDFILKNGQSFEREVLGKDDAEWMRGELGQCYKNTFELCTSEPIFTYCEGYAVADKLPLPLLHAWAVTPGGNVVDPTWKNGQAYFGVKFPLWYCMKVMWKTEMWGVLDSWTIQFPLLTGKHPWPLIKEEVRL